MAVIHYPTISMKYTEKHQVTQNFFPRIPIGNRVTATAESQIAVMNEITIEDVSTN